MNSTAVALIVFACVFGGAMLGLWLRAALPGHHLSSESKDTVKIGMGLVGTMTALLLSLQIASAKSSYDTRKNEITEMAAKIRFLDRILTNYGPQAAEVRTLLRHSVGVTIDGIWPRERSAATAAPAVTDGPALYEAIHQLTPENELQRSLKGEALNIAAALGLARWVLFEQSGSSIMTPFLIVTVAWLTMIFTSFGLFAPPNGTVITTLLFSAISVCAALFLVLELDQPFSGVIQIASAPMRDALSSLGQ